MTNVHPLLRGLTPAQIHEAAERWLAMLLADHLTWTSHAGYDGDEYPVSNPDEMFLSLSMWTRHDAVKTAEACPTKTHQQTEAYLTQFADKMREIIARTDAESRVTLPPLPLKQSTEEPVV